MNSIECIKSRATVRSFRPDPVPDKTIEDIIEAAMQAPSAGNAQDWEFVIVTKKETKDRLVEASWGQEFIAGAPVVIIVCSNTKRIGSAYGERGTTLYSVQDTAAATQNLMLAAWDTGLGTCWVGSFNEEKVREVLVLPTHVRPLAIIPMGFPASKPQKPARRKIGELLHREYY